MSASGNMADQLSGGQRIVDLRYDAAAFDGVDADPNMAYTATIRGWHRDTRTVGTGRTPAKAVADLANLLGETVEHLTATAHVNEIDGPEVR